MDGLKALLAKKRKAADEEFGGRKQVKRVDIEQARIKQLRTEEQNELGAKVSSLVHLALPLTIACLAKLTSLVSRKQSVHSREEQTAAGSCKGLTLVPGPTLKRPYLRKRLSDG